MVVCNSTDLGVCDPLFKVVADESTAENTVVDDEDYERSDVCVNRVEGLFGCNGKRSVGIRVHMRRSRLLTD